MKVNIELTQHRLEHMDELSALRKILSTDGCREDHAQLLRLIDQCGADFITQVFDQVYGEQSDALPQWDAIPEHTEGRLTHREPPTNTRTTPQ